MRRKLAALVGATILGTLPSCTDTATAPEFRPSSFLAVVGGGDPPPPPARGDPIPFFGASCYDASDPPGTINPCQFEIIGPVEARLLLNPAETVGFVEFNSAHPRVFVSGNARIRIAGGDFHGSGTISLPLDLVDLVDPLLPPVYASVDLSGAWIWSDIVPGVASIFAPVTYANGDPILVVTETGVIVHYNTAVLSYRFRE